MAPRARTRSFLRLVPVAALLLGFVLTVGAASAAAPTVTANPALVPFDPTPGKPGTTTLTFNAGGSTGLTACGQDNANLPTFPLGPVDPNTPLVVPFPFIQAGTYTFWVSTDSTCAATGGKLAQATAARVGPTGKAGEDAVQFRVAKGSVAGTGGGDTGNVNTLDVTINGAGASGAQQTFPIPGVQLCIMSGDGAQVSIAMKVGQDSRTLGLGTTATTTTVTPVAGQNGCFDIPWVVNGGYTATIVRSGASSTFGFCLSANKPSVAPQANGVGKCAQVALFPAGGAVPSGTTITGAIVTGADNHAVEVCVSAFLPNPSPITPVPIPVLPNQVNSFNASGAVDLTPLKLAFPSTTVAQVTTYDITGPGPGGQGGTQFVCPASTAVQGGQTVTIIPASVGGASIIDIKNYFVL